MEAGHLVGDDIILGVVRDELAKPEAAKGVIFDGVVRTIPQAEGVERMLADRAGAWMRCCSSTSPTRRSWPGSTKRRTIEGRADDDPAAVATRLRAYREQTAPVLAWYDARRARAADPGRRPVEEIGRPGARGSSDGSMITLKSPREIEIMARAGRIVAGTLALMREIVAARRDDRGPRRGGRAVHPQPRGATPSFKGLYGFPKTLCIVDRRQEIVHGIPSTKRVLREGSIVSVDVGVQLEGLHADAATTHPGRARSRRRRSGCSR